MSAIAGNLEVHIANEIQIRSYLLLAVDAATEYFLTEWDSTYSDFSELKPNLRWSIHFQEGREYLLSEYHEYPNGNLSIAKRMIPVAHMLDPVNRQIWMLRLLRNVNKIRSKQVMSRIEQIIQHMEEEEERSGH